MLNFQHKNGCKGHQRSNLEWHCIKKSGILFMWKISYLYQKPHRVCTMPLYYKSSLQRKFPDLWICINFSMLFMSTCSQLKFQGLITLPYTPSIKKRAHQNDPCTLYYTGLCKLEFQNFNPLLEKRAILVKLPIARARKQLVPYGNLIGPSCSSCRLCTTLILDPATKNNCFLSKQIVF